jgi:chitin disaccharide deacetylase
MRVKLAVIQELIITGDDYGLCAAVNDAIEECLAAGTMGATCVMTNMPSCAQASGLRDKFPLSSIGLHWNLTQGEPLLSPAAVPTLVGEDGRFACSLRRRWWARQLNFAEMRAELVVQYERFRLLAGKPDFWNTHQNVHVFPGLFQFFVDLGKELNIPAMRSHERITLPSRSSVSRYHLRHPAYWLKGQVIRLWSMKARAKGMSMPDGRLYLPGYEAGQYALTSVLGRVNWRNVSTAVELVIHPAKALDSRLFGGLMESRLREYEMFREPRLVGKLERAGVRLVGFDALRQNGHLAHTEKAA